MQQGITAVVAQKLKICGNDLFTFTVQYTFTRRWMDRKRMLKKQSRLRQACSESWSTPVLVHFAKAIHNGMAP